MQGEHDPANRGAFPWHRPESWDTDLLREFQRLIALRRSSPALRRGSYKILAARGDLFAHARQLGDETLVVVFNAGRSQGRLDLRLSGLVADGTILEDARSQDVYRIDRGVLGISVAPRESLILATHGPGRAPRSELGS